jgi:hypothetical protein
MDFFFLQIFSEKLNFTFLDKLGAAMCAVKEEVL